MALKLSDFQEGQVKEVQQPKKGLAAGVGTFAKGVPVGVAKSVGETALGIGQIGRGIQRGVSRVGDAVLGRFNPFQISGESIFDPAQAQQIRETTLAANAPGQGTGKFIGTALQYLAPTSRIAQGQQVLGAAARQIPTTLGGTGLLRTAGNVAVGTARLGAQGAARFVPEAIGTGAVAAVRSGGDLEQAKEEALLAGSFSVGLGALGGLARASYWPTLEDSVSKALGSQGKKSGGAALRQTAEKVTGLKVLKDRADDLIVTLDDGTKASFNPDTASYSTTLQAWNEAKNKIFDEYTSLASKAGEKSTINLGGVRQQIAEALDAPILSTEKNAVRSILKDFDDIFKNPNNVDIKTAERFVKSLNDNTVNGFFTGTADAASSKVNAGTSKLIREIMDEAITEAEGPGYQALRSQYAALKSIEDDLVRKFQQDARSIGGGLSEYTGAFASGDIIGSALSLDPAQFAKGATLGTFAALKRTLSNPERFLRRSFDLIDEAPSDLSLRIWGGSRPLSAAEQKAADDVAKSIKEPNIGLSIKNVADDASFNQGATPSTNLLEEAKKYKSAEEFVKAQGTLAFRGGAKLNNPKDGITQSGDMGVGLYLTESQKLADVYGKRMVGDTASLSNYVISKDANFVDFDSKVSSISSDDIKNIIDQVKPPQNSFASDVKKLEASFGDTLRGRRNSIIAIYQEAGLGKENANKGWLSLMQREGIDGLKYNQNATMRDKNAVFLATGEEDAINYVVYNTDILLNPEKLSDVWKKANPPK